MDPTSVCQRILIVDDDWGIAELLRRMLEPQGFEVIHAPNGLAALDEVGQCVPDLILMDVEMPHLGGYETTHMLKSDPRTRFVPIVILTGIDDSQARMKAWEMGADDFLTKPFQCIEVLARCRSLLKVKVLIEELDNAQAVMVAFARTVEAKSPYTLGHTERVTKYAKTLAEKMGLSESEREVLIQGSALHDIGKISLPDAILNKPGPLTRDEFDLVKQHPSIGARIVEPLRSLREAIPLIRWHHERLDGAGYPDGLFGGAIPLLTRVLSVADVYDALASVRPYRAALTHERCIELMEHNAAGGGLDPDIVEVFAGIGPEVSLATASGVLCV